MTVLPSGRVRSMCLIYPLPPHRIIRKPLDTLASCLLSRQRATWNAMARSSCTIYQSRWPSCWRDFVPTINPASKAEVTERLQAAGWGLRENGYRTAGITLGVLWVSSPLTWPPLSSLAKLGQLGGVHPHLCQQPSRVESFPRAHEWSTAWLTTGHLWYAPWATTSELGPWEGSTGEAWQKL